MTELTNKAEQKLLKMKCDIISIQYPFIIFSKGNNFYKCKDTDIIIAEDLWELSEKSLKLETIKDLK